MYPRNAASPERIAIGAVVQISDGAVQTTGVSVKVMPQGAAASAGGGTIAYEEGVVHYVPTQAETNYSSFMVIAYKTGCIPAAVTVVTSASATPGYAGVDWSKVVNNTSTVSLSGTTVGTITSYTGNTPQTGDTYALANGASGFVAIKTQAAAIEVDTTDIQSRLPAALIGGRIDANMQAGATGVISASLLASDAANEIADALLDRADAIETGETLRMAVRHTVSAVAGVLSGAATTSIVIKGAGVATTRISATVDADGNRSAVTLS